MSCYFCWLSVSSAESFRLAMATLESINEYSVYMQLRKYAAQKFLNFFIRNYSEKKIIFLHVMNISICLCCGRRVFLCVPNYANVCVAFSFYKSDVLFYIECLISFNLWRRHVRYMIFPVSILLVYFFCKCRRYGRHCYCRLGHDCLIFWSTVYLLIQNIS